MTHATDNTNANNENNASNSLPVGYRLNHYIIEAAIGEGGFGVVYRAHHELLDDRVAIKEFLPSQIAFRANTVVAAKTNSDALYQEHLQRFIYEGRTLIALNHRNIVRCRDLFVANNTAYLVMDFELGESLMKLTKLLEAKGGRFDEVELLHVLVPLAQGLAYIHGQGVLHRDIKPDNVFIRRADSTPVIIDFGAAKQNFAHASQSQAPYTEFYAPAEQIEGGGEAKPTVDVHAFGGLMYRLVMGCVGPSATSRMYSMATGKPDPYQSVVPQLAGQYSPELLQLIDHCLAFSAGQRPQSMAEVLTVLQQCERRLAPSSNQTVATTTLASAVTDTPQPAKTLKAKASVKASAKASGTAKSAESKPAVPKPAVPKPVRPRDAAEPQKAVAERQTADHCYFTLGNMPLALHHYQLAADAGSGYACAQVARLLKRTDGHSSNALQQALVKKASAKLAKALDQRYACYLQAVLAHELAADTARAIDWLKQGDKLGDAAAQNYFGLMYEQGQGVGQSDSKALAFYRKAAKQGFAFAQNNLGWLYAKGRGVALSNEQAVECYQQAALQHNARAQANLGWMYANGRGVKQSDVEALRYFQLAAAANDAVGQFNLGEAYFFGKGVTASLSDAMAWFKKSAKQHHELALLRMGEAYLAGRGVAQSAKLAVQSFTDAAELGNRDAQFQLGLLYRHGKGVSVSDDQAYFWFSQAAAQGHSQAAAMAKLIR